MGMVENMRVVVKFFASLREITGKEKIEIDVEEGCTVGKVLETFKNQYPEMRKYTDVILSLNRQYCTGDEKLSEGDEVTIMPPLSGG